MGEIASKDVLQSFIRERDYEVIDRGDIETTHCAIQSQRAINRKRALQKLYEISIRGTFTFSQPVQKSVATVEKLIETTDQEQERNGDECRTPNVQGVDFEESLLSVGIIKSEGE